ncbi:MAG: ABC transporter permease, partial [Clostridium sp.]
MHGYGEITNKYIKKNKKRTIFTIVGIILSLALISGIGFLGYSFKDFMIENAKADGDYEIRYNELSKEQVEILRNDVDLSNLGIYKYSGIFRLELESENYIDIYSYDKGALNNIFKPEVTEGVYPTQSNEIVISKRVKEKFNVEIGENIDLNSVSYSESGQVISEEYTVLKVVGFIDEKFESGNYYSAISYLDVLSNEEEYVMLFSLGNAKNKMNLANDKAENLG